jgi:hypothetical protein
MLTLDPSFRYLRRNKLSPFINIIDIADYRVGWIFSVPCLKILKIKTSKIMESPKYVTIIKIFNLEFARA